jgi:archaellum biogenesis ATPase FlaH
VVFQNSQVAKQQEQTIQLTRVFKEFVNERMGVVKVVTDSANENRKEARLKILRLEDAEFSRHQKCIFLLDSLNDAVVIDKENRIRGQYVMSNREEADRLIMELKILLKKY